MTFSLTLRHAFPTVRIDMAFDVPTPGVTVLFGPSGAGKSTVLLAAAGLLRPAMCRIQVDDTVLADTTAGTWLPPEKRRVGLVFQDARLVPHMSVANNLRFGLRRAPPGPIRFDEIVDLLGIGAVLDRRPHTLSGGERQRVAIGRALLAQPRLLLMDEPLASLDASRKADILPYLQRLKTVLRLPVIYVTHAPDEVARLADTLVLIEEGRVAGHGPLAEIASRTDLPFARRDDAGAVIECRIAAHDTARELTRLEGAGTSFWVPLVDAAPGSACRIGIPAREIILAVRPPDAISLHNVISGTVRQITAEPTRRSVLVEIALPSGMLLARVTPDAIARLGLARDGTVLALVKSTSITVMPGAAAR
jgi:molybdate transport system ATP-binding protein